MYQATVVQAERQQTRPPRPVFRLCGRQVTQEMYYAAEQAKRARRRALLDNAGQSELTAAIADDDCDNCGGFGHLALEVVMAGPFRDFPQVKSGNGEEGAGVDLRPAFHNGSWWLVVRQLYPCPVCSNNRTIDL